MGIVHWLLQDEISWKNTLPVVQRYIRQPYFGSWNKKSFYSVVFVRIPGHKLIRPLLKWERKENKIMLVYFFFMIREKFDNGLTKPLLPITIRDIVIGTQ